MSGGGRHDIATAIAAAPLPDRQCANNVALMNGTSTTSPARQSRVREKLRNELIRSGLHSPLATIVTDATTADNAIIAVNHAFERLSGYREVEMIGCNCRILAGKDTASSARTMLREAVAAGKPAFTTLLNYRKNGESFHNAVMIAPVHDEKGMLAFFLGTQMEVQNEDAGRVRAEAWLATLTPQQSRVLARMARGLRQVDIAKELGLSIKTVKMHRGALVRRLGVSTSTEAIRVAVEGGL